MGEKGKIDILIPSKEQDSSLVRGGINEQG